MSDTNTSTPNIPAKNVLWLSGEMQTETPAVQRPEATPVSTSSFTTQSRGNLALRPTIGIDRLYEAPRGTTSNMVRALELLKSASDNLAAALRYDNPMEADRFVQHVQLDLPKLFACRSIGDGFGAMINALYYAFHNQRGKPLARNQINLVWRALRELRSRPVMSLEQAIEYVDEFEAQGLQVDPEGIANILANTDAAEDE